MVKFPENFVWGTATSSIQIEGVAPESGKGKNIWDEFSHIPGKTKDGYTPDIACDHFHRYKEDVQIMKQMGIQAYRFSIDWSRVIPDGVGKVNEKGLQFYSDLIDELLENNIEPYVTLYHWELPVTLHHKGGWFNDEIVEWFGNYAALIARTFGNRVKHFFTINEPQCFIGLGYLQGVHAPGYKCSVADTLRMSHNVLKAHGRAVQRIREYAPDAQVGFAPTCGIPYPASDKAEDVEAARQVMFSVPEIDNWTWNVSWWSDPVLLGHYPEEALRKFHKELPDITKEDLKLISEPIDIYGQNIYNGWMVKMGEDGKPVTVPRYQGFPTTATGWPITPECLYWGPKFLYERYQKPIYITENGISCNDVVSLDGKVHDAGRIDFEERYLAQLNRAIQDGADIRGYFYWSLMDNFEWSEGYTQRFGLVYVDYRTGERIPKDSARWYQKVIENNALTF